MGLNNTKNRNIFFASCLTLGLMVSFQNCSSSVLMLGSVNSAHAKTDLNEIVADSEKELTTTTAAMKKNEQLIDGDQLEKADRVPAQAGELVEMDAGGAKIKTVLKTTKKTVQKKKSKN